MKKNMIVSALLAVARKLCGPRFMACLVFAFALVLGGVASAQTDMATTITTVSGYWTSVEVIGVGILVFVIGRRIVRKI